MFFVLTNFVISYIYNTYISVYYYDDVSQIHVSCVVLDVVGLVTKRIFRDWHELGERRLEPSELRGPFRVIKMGLWAQRIRSDILKGDVWIPQESAV